MNGAELITAERTRQIFEEGFLAEHDAGHSEEELVNAAHCYLNALRARETFGNYDIPLRWPWEEEWWKPTPDDRIKELTKAGALIAAEIDRLLRLNRPLKIQS